MLKLEAPSDLFRVAFLDMAADFARSGEGRYEGASATSMAFLSASHPRRRKENCLLAECPHLRVAVNGACTPPLNA
jgi:hypothetical protein